MADFVTALKKDLVEQFRGKPNIEALMEVISIELQQVYDFYEQLRENRDVLSATGKQLDGVGDIVVLNRMEAGILAGDPIPFEVMEDDMYRQYLIFKILKNTCDCTYPDIIKAFRMFWNRPLYYHEDPEQPATMIFDTGEITADVDISPLVRVPVLRAAGVGILIIFWIVCQTPATIRIGGGAGVLDTLGFREKEDVFDFQDGLYMGGAVGAVDTLGQQEKEDAFDFQDGLYMGGKSSPLAILPQPESRKQPEAVSILRTGGVCTIISHLSKGE